ncbi:MAG: hypothetical protein CVU17_04295 [Betaproteobacteria bacterium HGW-Betaproteobacteria-11]|nr:MAG: hypothetical protein CVU17_04295 [Betaproteobacteria bacterium HGW-Betaproteobacteria-11]
MPHAYAGRCFALLTQHGKEAVIAPLLEPALGCRVERVTGYDTDQLGTFTRDIPRLCTQLDAARRKARIGMELAGVKHGLASEGSFGPDPFAGMFSWNVEVLILVDAELGIEVFGIFQGPGRGGHALVGDGRALEDFAHKAGFPEHHLVLRPAHQDDTRIRKGIADWTTLAAAFAATQRESASGKVFVEHDLRAHAHPERMRNIRKAAEDLLRKIRTPCPACGCPGYAPTERIDGLLCADCGAPTRETRAEVWACVRCTYRETRERSDRLTADPGRCDYCNP